MKRKLVLGVLSTLLMTVMLAGCSSSYKKLIVGRWGILYYSKYGFEFYSNGEGILFSNNEYEDITWSISGDNLEVVFYVDIGNESWSEAYSYTILELTESYMILYDEFAEESVRYIKQ